MKTKTTWIVAGGLALASVPSAFAADGGARFKEMDADRDGRITKAEYAAAEQAKFARLDTNRDGIISTAELATGPLPTNDNPTTPADGLRESDLDSDRQLTRAEQTLGIEKRFAALDTNRDGTLNEQELAAGIPRPLPAP